MKAAIHPAYEEVNVICACGNSFKTRSTHKGDIRVEICSNCHPFFTGRQKLVDTEGRVDRFQKKVQKSKDIQAAKDVLAAKKNFQEVAAPSVSSRFYFWARAFLARSSRSWRSFSYSARCVSARRSPGLDSPAPRGSPSISWLWRSCSAWTLGSRPDPKLRVELGPSDPA